MNRLLLCTLLLVSCGQKSIKQEPIPQGVLDTISYEYTAYFSDKNYNNYREDYIVYVNENGSLLIKMGSTTGVISFLWLPRALG